MAPPDHRSDQRLGDVVRNDTSEDPRARGGRVPSRRDGGLRGAQRVHRNAARTCAAGAWRNRRRASCVALPVAALLGVDEGGVARSRRHAVDPGRAAHRRNRRRADRSGRRARAGRRQPGAGQTARARPARREPARHRADGASRGGPGRLLHRRLQPEGLGAEPVAVRPCVACLPARRGARAARTRQRNAFSQRAGRCRCPRAGPPDRARIRRDFICDGPRVRGDVSMG